MYSLIMDTIQFGTEDIQMKILLQAFCRRIQRLPSLATSALAIGGLSALLFLPRLAAAEQNPIAEDRPAPELVGGPWLNTDNHTSINLASRHGKVTLVEF